MEIIYTKTSSQGNCTIIKSGEGEMIAIDAGIDYKKVDKEIEYSLYNCHSLILTHRHADHCIKSKDFVRHGVSLYCPLEVVSTGSVKQGYNIHIVRDRQQFEVDGFKIVPFSLIHEDGFKIVPFSLIHEGGTGIPCECYGYLIQDVSTGEKMLHCTDTQCIPYSFPPMEYYNLEANYWEQDDFYDCLDVIEKSVEMRRMRSHMSVETAADFLKKQDLSKCKEIHLLHLSSSITKEKREQIIPYIKEQIGRTDIDVFI